MTSSPSSPTPEPLRLTLTPDQRDRLKRQWPMVPQRITLTEEQQAQVRAAGMDVPDPPRQVTGANGTLHTPEADVNRGPGKVRCVCHWWPVGGSRVDQLAAVNRHLDDVLAQPRPICACGQHRTDDASLCYAPTQTDPERYLGARVISCPECGHGIDSHGADPEGTCVAVIGGRDCLCLMSPNGIAADLLDRARRATYEEAERQRADQREKDLHRMAAELARVIGDAAESLLKGSVRSDFVRWLSNAQAEQPLRTIPITLSVDAQLLDAVKAGRADFLRWLAEGNREQARR